jgi:D-alanyl-D-alanine carboxypeptidase
MKNRVGRVIIGILALLLLGFYTYRQEQIHWHSTDVESWGPATGLHPEGFEAGVQMNAEPEAPVQMSYAAATEEPALPEAPAALPEEQSAPAEPALSQTAQLAAENAAALGLPAPPDVDVNSWELMLANARHPIQEYQPEKLAYLNQTLDETDIQTNYNPNRCPVDARIAEPLAAFALGCKEAGLPVYLSSGYRSYNEQNYLFQRKVGQGYSEDEAATIVARPGTSEHQTGLACDITDYYHELKDSSLEQTATYQWLREHCAEYGFVVRYPADKSGSADSVTGIIYEPWHFRYVGVEAARYMTENNLCLEEFLSLYGVE